MVAIACLGKWQRGTLLQGKVGKVDAASEEAMPKLGAAGQRC